MLELKGWNTSKSRRTQTTLLPAESLKLTAVSSLGGSRGLRNMAALMLFAIESHSSSQRRALTNRLRFLIKEKVRSSALPAAAEIFRTGVEVVASRGVVSPLGRASS